MDIDFNQLDAEAQALVISLLPVSAKEIADRIGLPATLAMITAFGGCEIRFAQDSYRGSAPESFRRLAEVVGEEAARQLNQHFGGLEYFYIPRCVEAMRALRDRLIIEDFNAIQKATNSARIAANEVGIRFKLSYRGVEKIVNGGYAKNRKGKK